MPKRRKSEIISKRHLHRCAIKQTKKDLEFLKTFDCNVQKENKNNVLNTQELNDSCEDITDNIKLVENYVCDTEDEHLNETNEGNEISALLQYQYSDSEDDEIVQY